MKKTLALVLASMMLLATVSLTSCSKNKNNNENENDSGNDFVFEEPSNNKGTSDETGSGEKNSDKATTSSEFTATSGTAYLLMNIYVRKTPKISSTSYVGSATWGSQVTRLETNGDWTKIKFTDITTKATKEGYVPEEALTTNKGIFEYTTFEEPVEVEVDGLGKKSDGSAITMNVRTSPWNSSKCEYVANKNVHPNIENIQISDGDKVTQVGETKDKEWAIIEIKFTVGGKEKTEWVFCSSQFVKGSGTETEDPGTSDKPGFNVDPA